MPVKKVIPLIRLRDRSRFGAAKARPSLKYVLSVSETTGGRDSALRCPRAVQARNGWGKIIRSLVPPLAAAVTAQRAVPTKGEGNSNHQPG